MAKKWLNLFFRYSALTFSLKQKIVLSDKWYKTFVYASVLVFLELLFAIITLPIYFVLTPRKIQERGWIFPHHGDNEPMHSYIVKRKISIGTVTGAGVVLVFKVFLLAIVSNFLLGGQMLLAATQTWGFDTASDYTYDSAKIEAVSGVARLKDISTPVTGSTVNSGFDTNTSSWAYASWQHHTLGSNSGNYQAANGNPGGYVNINLNVRKGQSEAGYWRQSFVTTVDNPSSATLDLDWKSVTFGGALTTYRLYAFIETGSGIPGATSTAVWNSGEITATTNWTSTTSINIASKLTTAGTYYLKIGAYATRPNGGSNNLTYISGFDNVIVSWSGSGAPSYVTDKPAITPNVSLSASSVSHWNTFAETATKNGGEIYYQLSDNDGATWKYWNSASSTWSVASTTVNYNTATVINTNITSFPVASNKIMWKAFLSSSGSQQVILDAIDINYTLNDLPDILSIAPAQSTSTRGMVLLDYNLQDNESDPSNLVNYEYSLTGVFGGEQIAMTPSTTYPGHSGISGLSTSPSGTAHTFIWDALQNLGSTYNNTVYVRLRANDGVGDGAYTTSSVFTVDLVNPVVSNVTSTQIYGSTNVQFTYDLFDDTSVGLYTEIDISSDGGATWVVPDTSVVGAVGANITAGIGKTIVWNAGTDFDEQSLNTIQVRIRAKDIYQNQGDNVTSTNFALDTLNPVSNVVANLKSQPNAGDTSVLIGGSFTENNPNTNDFYVAIDGGEYVSSTSGAVDTAAPGDQATNVGVALDGNDYVSKVKIIHVDDFGQSVTNENTSPNATYKYVKPYTPGAPILSNPITNRLNLTINPNASETTGLEYAVYETTTAKYVQADGTLGVSPVWRTDSAWGTITVTGLNSPVSQYVFQEKSRNTSDTSHAVTSESGFSATAHIINTAPVISLGAIAQTTDGSKYVNLNYTGTDGQGDINNFVTYEYSRDNSTWYTMTEKSGVGSDGITNLVFLPSGSAHKFVWDSGTDLSGVEDSTVYVRLRSTDTLVNSNLDSSGAFEIDNVLPVVTNVSAVQNSGARTVTISYDLADANSSLVELAVSEDGGNTWSVPHSTVSGNIGSGIAPGTNKTITWNVGADFDNQYQNDMQVRVRALDTFGNQGNYVPSSNFTVDTHAPIISNVTAVQDSAADTFTFHYDISEDAGNSNVVLEISNSSGSSWTVSTSTASGNIGSVVSGTGKTITWNGATDYSDHERTDMRIRINATDQYNNGSNNSSVDFSLDTLAPRVTSVTATQITGSTNVQISYNLADQNLSTVELDISSDSGSNWVVTDTSLSGDVGANIVAGTGKSVVWSAGTDFDEQDFNTMRVRVRARDIFANQSNNVSSTDYALDTLNPTVNVVANLKAQPLAGTSLALVGGSFTETNPNTNNFYVGIDDHDYVTSTSGSLNTATPSDQLTNVGDVLDGNDHVSKVKIIHVDDFGQSVTNENTSPNAAYAYVKPYTPNAPTVDNPTVGTVDVLINPHTSEATNLEYAIYENSQGKYVQANGTLGTGMVWKTLGTGSGQWGEYSGVSGKIVVNGLSKHSYTYQFQVKSRNISDVGHAITSESALSSGASSLNQAPHMTINSVGQTIDGTKYITTNYTGYDLESETSTLIVAEYSTNNTNWYNMTEKTGVGSEGKTDLSFTDGGVLHSFMWDVNTDLSNTEDSTVYIRLRANDGTSSGAVETSGAFIVDTKKPVISNVTAEQVANTSIVNFTYDLVDLSHSNIELDISEDGGLTWDVVDTSVGGDVGADITPGTNKVIQWNAGSNFSGQEQSDMRVRIRAIDSYGNQGLNVSSANFAVDTKNPVVSNVTAVQNVGARTVAIGYDLSDANDANVELDISSDGGLTWDVIDTSVTGDIGVVAPGAGQSIVWNAGDDYDGQDELDMRVRVRATDTFANESGDVLSSNFSLDTKGPNIVNVAAEQVVGSSNVSFSYDLADNSLVNIQIDISEDGGSTWDVVDTSVTGAIGSGVTQGTGKVIYWNAGTDFSGQNQIDMKVRVRGSDPFTNSSGDVSSADFTLDTSAPVVAVVSDLQSQPNAGDASILVGGSFTEVHPNANIFVAAVNGGAYVASTTGQSGTATPVNQATNVGVPLTGSDYVSKVKIVETDNYGYVAVNENTSPNTAYAYVKPYTPEAPIVNNPQNTSVNVTVSAHTGESVNVEYVILENSTNKYVQTDGSLDTAPVWKTATGWGTVTVTGLSSPVANYSFKVKSRNPSDSSHAISSESNWSDNSAIINTAPVISINSAMQFVSGTGYVLVNYTGTDLQNDTNDLTIYEFTTNTVSWLPMTERSGVGSDGVNDLIFSTTGTIFTFAWDANFDLPNVEDSSVFVRIGSSDSLLSSGAAQSGSISVDNRGPVVSNIIVSQNPSTSTFNFDYDLSDNSISGMIVQMAISADGGTTWTVPTTTITGDVGTGITAGVSRRITWNAGVDFAGEEQNDMRVKIAAIDSYGNFGDYTESNNFTVDTKSPVISSVSAVQTPGTTNVVVSYDLTDITPAGHTVDMAISNDSGLTWTVPTSSLTGDVGLGITTGSGKTITWQAGADFAGQQQNDMRVRVRAKDYFGSQGSYTQSADFTVDTKGPVISGLTATQNSTTRQVAISYDVNDISTTGTISFEISSNGGATWTVPHVNSSGDVGSGINFASGTRSIIWDAGADLFGVEQNNIRVHVKGTDSFNNQGSYLESADFSVDTKAPVGLISLSKFSATTTQVTLNWSSGVSDANFDHYEIWHGSNENDVQNRTGVASKWSVASDSGLSNINTISSIITGLSLTGNYYAKIWAVDSYGNEATVSDINVYEVAPVVIVPTVIAGGGGGAPIIDTISPGSPILALLDSPINTSAVVVSGLAEPRARIDLYDNGVLVGRFNSVVDDNGEFRQRFTFGEGVHSLSVKAVDFANNASEFSNTVNLVVDFTPPTVPSSILPTTGEVLSTATPVLHGLAEPNSTVRVSVDGNELETVALDNGVWSISLPSSLALRNGSHEVVLRAIDNSGNQSPTDRVGFSVAAAPVVIRPAVVPVTGVIVPTPLVPGLIEATEIPSLLSPVVTTVSSETAGNNITFVGTALPNQEVVAYVNSERTVVYRTLSDSNGVWKINHSQDTIELQSGHHTISAVSIDPKSKVKTSLGPVHNFTVSKSFWVNFYQHLNLTMTIITTVVLLSAILFLYRVKKRETVQA